MKKLLLILALALSQLTFAQQSAVVDLYVLDASGNPEPNFALTVYDFGSGSGTVLTMITDVNGRAIDSMAIGSTGMLYCDINVNGCIDTVLMSYTPNNGPIVYFSDTLHTCGTSSGNCNFAFGANPSLISPYDFMFWHQSANSTNTVWDFGDGNTSTQVNPSHTYSAPGTYIYCVSVDSCPTVCDTIVITGAQPNCNASFIIDSASSQPGNVVVWNTSTPAYTPNSLTQYTWDFGDGTTSSLPFPSHTYSGAGTYVICLAINVPATPVTPACSSLYCDTLKVDSLGNIIQKSTGAGFTLNVLDANTIGIEESSFLSTSVYPNPATDFIKIDLDVNLDGEVNFELIDMNGSIVLSKSDELSAGLNTIEISVNQLNTGMYFIKITKGGSHHFEKIIIQ